RRTAVMADVGDEAVALLMDGRLVGAAGLQVVQADEAHVTGLGRVADLGRLRRRRHRQRDGKCGREVRKASVEFFHGDPPQHLFLVMPTLAFAWRPAWWGNHNPGVSCRKGIAVDERLEPGEP